MTDFAAIEARANTAIFSRLANTTATVGGNSMRGIFDTAFSLGSVGPFGIASSQPRLTLPTASLPADPVGQACTVGAASYLVAEHQPDGTGISVLLLEVAA